MSSRLRVVVQPRRNSLQLNWLALSFIIVSMTAIEPATERAARAFLHRVTRRYDVTGAILFGSRARGDFRSDSDADIAVLLAGEAGEFFDTQRALSDIAYDVLLAPIFVSALPIWQEEWDHPDRTPAAQYQAGGDRPVKPEGLLAKAERALESADLLLSAGDQKVHAIARITPCSIRPAPRKSHRISLNQDAGTAHPRRIGKGNHATEDMRVAAEANTTSIVRRAWRAPGSSLRSASSCWVAPRRDAPDRLKLGRA